MTMPVRERKKEYQSLVSPCVRIGGLSRLIHIPQMKARNTAEPSSETAIAGSVFFERSEMPAPTIQQRDAAAAKNMKLFHPIMAAPPFSCGFCRL
jgi:hypothetical protein